jgi:hypothetical protein
MYNILSIRKALSYEKSKNSKCFNEQICGFRFKASIAGPYVNVQLQEPFNPIFDSIQM